MTHVRRYPRHFACAALCVGLATPNLVRVSVTLIAGAAFVAVAAAAKTTSRLPLVAALLFLVGWTWGSARLAAIDRSPLSGLLGRADQMRAVVTAAPRRGRFDIRAPALILRFGRLRVDEPALLRLPLRRAPPQGAIVAAIGQLTAPRPPRNGFDERTWLRRHGMHVVVRVATWRAVGHRGGIGGVADRVRAWLAGSVVRGTHGERVAVLEGIVLGDDSGLSEELRQRFRASGLYHLLAVSGQNVALIVGGAVTLAWLLGVSRWIGEVGALAGIVAYILAVGPQPSIIRAGIAGALGSLAWLTARITDRWYFLLVGAVVLLAWNPYTLFDAGFELSFAAVVAIFVVVPRWQRVLAGYPVPQKLAEVVLVSAVCGLATAPILWVQFHAIPLLAIPANALAAPAMVPLLGFSFAGALLSPALPNATTTLTWLNGWLAAYLAGVARLIGGLPGAQVRSTASALLLLAGVLLVAAYAWSRRGERPEAGVPDRRERPAEDPARAPPTA